MLSLVIVHTTPVVIIDSDNDSDTSATNYDTENSNKEDIGSNQNGNLNKDDSCVPGFSLDTPELLSREQSYVSLIERREFDDINSSYRGMSSGKQRVFFVKHLHCDENHILWTYVPKS